MVGWVDILTAKQAHFFKHFIDRYKLLATTRQYSESLAAINFLNIKCDVIGKHGANVLEKLINSVERSYALLKWFLDKKPNFLISHGSVEATRIAFQAGIPIFDFNDTPESIFVARLTAPLTTLMIVPKDCGEGFRKYGAQNVIEYDGLTQVTWLKRYKYDIEIVKKLNLDENKITVIVREPAYLASHIESDSLHFKKIVSMLKEFSDEINLIEIERYKGKFIDVPSLLNKADIVIATGTMVGEAIVSGVPLVIDYFPVLQSMYKRFSKEEFFLHSTNLETIISHVKNFIRDPRKRREPMYYKMEDPLDIFDEIIREKFPNLLE
jgi:predicted glycosyltransferase